MGVSEVGNRSAVAFARQGSGWVLRLALSVTVALLLTAASHQAWAGACAKARLKPGCVNSADVRNRSLTASDMSDEPGAHFALGRDVLATVGNIPKTVASITVTRPSQTFRRVVVSWSVNISSTLEPDSKGFVSCGVKEPKGTFPTLSKDFYDGAIDRKTKPSTSMGATMSFKIRKKNKADKLKFRLVCETFTSDFKRVVLAIGRPSLTAIIYP